jgi:hypothetical protein
MLNELEILAASINRINDAYNQAIQANVPFGLRRVLLHMINYLDQQIKDYLQS